ncbi:MAG: FAD-dependent oxidoreductase [Acidobacteria bacterium]|nr:FAD-dependent oxidoreductase [Acidobacteriota bacterium]
MSEQRTIAAKMLCDGAAFHTSVSGEPRAPLCGMGVCMECRATVDGSPHQRTCQTLMDQPPSTAPHQAHFDVLVVGAGPAGLAALWAASQSGVTAGMVDDNPAAGGQIWRNALPAEWAQRAARLESNFLPGTRIYATASTPNGLWAERGSPSQRVHITYNKLILATGARERFLPFPGWTLPGVFGAGGLQALVKTGLPVEGKRVVVAGSGPLLLAVAAYLKKRGARISLIAEQTTRARRNDFLTLLLRNPSKLLQAVKLRAQLGAIRYRMSTWVTRAQGEGRLQGVTLNGGRTLDCDYLACGFGLVPNTELAALLGCRIDDGYVAVNHSQQTTVDNIYCAGEPTGIGGVDKAIAEGLIAGYAATGQTALARAGFPKRDRGNLFRRQLDTAFALRPELAAITTPDTIVCRCEDVHLAKILDHRSWRDLKLQTRCGMGPCQGRICGPAVEYLRGWPADSVRPPLYPVEARHLL